ncbi:MAG: transcriptional repressor LexA [Acidaminococcales bacterium]|nr:transcriptional repressor LexA [Acidaminococcales bacterium]
MTKKATNSPFDQEPSLTKAQTDILEYIRNFVRTNGYPPSVREIGKAVGFASSASIHAHLRKLESAGYLQRNPFKSRTVEVTQDAMLRQQTMVPVPLVGRVTAGQPILAEENIEATYPLPAEFIGTRSGDDVFMLTISGDSMVNAGILDRDIVLVRRQQTADNGDIVVALLLEENQATVKRFFRESNRIKLQPENELMQPIYSDNVAVLGKVIGVFRFL